MSAAVAVEVSFGRFFGIFRASALPGRRCRRSGNTRQAARSGIQGTAVSRKIAPSRPSHNRPVWSLPPEQPARTTPDVAGSSVESKPLSLLMLIASSRSSESNHPLGSPSTVSIRRAKSSPRRAHHARKAGAAAPYRVTTKSSAFKPGFYCSQNSARQPSRILGLL